MHNPPLKMDAFMVVKNVTRLGYPWVESILGVLPFVDRFWVEEGNGDDDTFKYLQMLAVKYPGKFMLSRFDWPQLETGFAIGAAMQHLLDRLNTGSVAPWLLYVQADELWHPESLEYVRYISCISGEIDSAQGGQFEFLHIAKNFQERQFPEGRESYVWATRLIRNTPRIKSHRDAWTFEEIGPQAVIHMKHPIVHANSTYWEHWASKARNHAELLYRDLPMYKVSGRAT